MYLVIAITALTAVILLDVAAIANVLRSTKPDFRKLLWSLLILSLPVVGASLYFMLGRKLTSPLAAR